MIRYYVFTPDGGLIASEPCGELALPYMTPGRVMLRGTEAEARALEWKLGGWAKDVPHEVAS